mgnify:CR=1 FL=1
MHSSLGNNIKTPYQKKKKEKKKKKKEIIIIILPFLQYLLSPSFM